MTETSLAAALVAFQATVPVIPKNRTAKISTKSGGSYSYKYADLADVFSAIREPLKSAGLAVTQTLLNGSTGWTGIKTTIWHESGDKVEDVLEIPTQGKTAQEAGSQFTYYRRYALTAALGISTEEDDDGAAGNERPVAQPQAKQPPKNADALKLVKAARERAGMTADEAADMFQERFEKPITSGSTEELAQLVDKLTAIAVDKEMAG